MTDENDRRWWAPEGAMVRSLPRQARLYANSFRPTTT